MLLRDRNECMYSTTKECSNDALSPKAQYMHRKWYVSCLNRHLVIFWPCTGRVGLSALLVYQYLRHTCIIASAITATTSTTRQLYPVLIYYHLCCIDTSDTMTKGAARAVLSATILAWSFASGEAASLASNNRRQSRHVATFTPLVPDGCWYVATIWRKLAKYAPAKDSCDNIVLICDPAK